MKITYSCDFWCICLFLRVTSLTRLPPALVELSEPLQVIRFKQGDFSNAHHDSNPSNSETVCSHTRLAGNKSALSEVSCRCVFYPRGEVSKGHFYVRTRVWYIMIQVIFAAGYIWQKKGRITWLLFWLSSNSSSPYILTYSLYEQKIVICTIFISCLKRCFIVHVPLDVAVAQNEAPIRSLNSGHNRKNAANPNVLPLVEPLVLLFILFFLFSFLCPVFSAALFVNFNTFILYPDDSRL